MCQHSQKWAETLADRDTGPIFLSHSKSQDHCYGENVAGFSTQVSVKEIIKIWYDEIQYYRFGKTNFSSSETGTV